MAQDFHALDERAPSPERELQRLVLVASLAETIDTTMLLSAFGIVAGVTTIATAHQEANEHPAEAQSEFVRLVEAVATLQNAWRGLSFGTRRRLVPQRLLKRLRLVRGIVSGSIR